MNDVVNGKAAASPIEDFVQKLYKPIYLWAKGTFATKSETAAIIVASSESVPDGSTLSYTKDGVEHDFKVGDELRVYSQEYGKQENNYFVYYKLYDLVTDNGVTTAKWGLLGAGDATENDLLNIEVTASDNDDTDLAKVKVYVTVGENAEQELTGTVTSHVKKFSVIIESGSSYSVRFGGVAGYATPASLNSQTKGNGVETKTAQYLTTLVGLSMTGRSDGVQGSAPQGAGGTVKYSGGTDQHITSGTAKVPRGTAFTIDYDDVSGYSTPSQFSQASGYSSETITATAAEYSQGHLTIGMAQTGGYDADLSGAGFTLSIGGSTATYQAGMAVPTGAAVVIEFNGIEGYAKPQQLSFSMTSEAKSVTGTYTTSPITVTMASNQSSDATIGALRASVEYTYGGSTVTKDNLASGSTVKVPTGVTPTITFPNAPTGYSRSISGDGLTATYSTTILTVALTSDTGEADLSDVTITVTDITSSSTVSAQQNGTYLIPSGHTYTVSVSDDVDGYSAPDTTEPYTAASTANASRTVTMEYTEVTNYVDLGLPSGLKWATGNICKDATTGEYYMGEPTDYGCYFSWGNIDGHNQAEGYNFDQSNYSSSPGNSVSADIGSNDADHDAALARLKSPWRIPTGGELQELSNNTDREWTSINGVYGMKFMKKTDHSVFIFMPATGRINGTSYEDAGVYGRYWSSSINSNGTSIMRFGYNTMNVPQWHARYFGLTIRPVR